jgi:hypothetical protein
MKHKRTTGKTKKSWIWDHGANIESENEQYWLCRRCHETGSDCSTIFKYNGNSAIAYHLKHNTAFLRTAKFLSISGFPTHGIEVRRLIALVHYGLLLLGKTTGSSIWTGLLLTT